MYYEGLVQRGVVSRVHNQAINSIVKSTLNSLWSMLSNHAHSQFDRASLLVYWSFSTILLDSESATNCHLRNGSREPRKRQFQSDHDFSILQSPAEWTTRVSFDYLYSTVVFLYFPHADVFPPLNESLASNYPQACQDSIQHPTRCTSLETS